MTFQLPPSFCNDHDWTGLALCASFSIFEHPAAFLDNLDLETEIGIVDPPHTYCLTKKDVILLNLGGFLWLSFLPCESLPDCLNQCTSIEASIASDFPGLISVGSVLFTRRMR